jgi:hypothetical protein
MPRLGSWLGTKTCRSKSALLKRRHLGGPDARRPRPRGVQILDQARREGWRGGCSVGVPSAGGCICLCPPVCRRPSPVRARRAPRADDRCSERHPTPPFGDKRLRASYARSLSNLTTTPVFSRQRSSPRSPEMAFARSPAGAGEGSRRSSPGQSRAVVAGRGQRADPGGGGRRALRAANPTQAQLRLPRPAPRGRRRVHAAGPAGEESRRAAAREVEVPEELL